VPILFGPAGAISAGLGYAKGDRLGIWAVAAGVVVVVLSLALGAAVIASR
jgi:hypothetical protein